MMTSTRARYAGYRFPSEIISHAVWLYFRFPLGLRMVEELLAARGIIVSHETVRQWARKFGQQFAVHNTFNLQRHLVSRPTLRIFRAEATTASEKGEKPQAPCLKKFQPQNCGAVAQTFACDRPSPG
jgi:hypothetical protein